MRRLLLAAALFTLLAACGTKGSLVPPPKPQAAAPSLDNSSKPPVEIV